MVRDDARWRRAPRNQDAHSTILDLDESTAFFAVFDGHGGKEVALYASRHLHEAFKATEGYANGDLSRGLVDSFLSLDVMMKAKESAKELRELRAEGEKGSGAGSGRGGGEGGLESLIGGGGSGGDGGGGGEGGAALSSAEAEKKARRAEINATLRAALLEQVKEANPGIAEEDIKFDFELDDEDFEELAPSPSGATGTDDWNGPQAGATSVVVCIRGDKAYCANAGDSRAVFSRKGGVAVDMSYDHKPTNASERERIQAAGGFVSEGRVNGSLALSRALGDFEYKGNKDLPPDEQAVTAHPDVKEFQLEDGDEFMILACDGIWDVMTSQKCVDFVRERIIASNKDGGGELKLSKICEELCDECLAPDTRGTGLGCDNMSVVIVLLKQRQSMF